MSGSAPPALNAASRPSPSPGYRICTRCVTDTTELGLTFDSEGRCFACTAAIHRLQTEIPTGTERVARLEQLVDAVRADGRGKDYDCVIGVSGGIDSTAVAYHVRTLGLRPIAVHFDNGWDSELAVANVRRTLDALRIDLITLVVDWEEFRDLQLSFLRASLANCEAPTDHGITALLFQTARRFGLRYVLSGSNLTTEAVAPIQGAYFNQDLRLLRAVHDRFGSVPLRTFPTISIAQYFEYVFGRRMRQIPVLNLLEYDKAKMKDELGRELGWRDYGTKHGESIWTRFFQGWYLCTKFNYDKRRAHLSSLICSGQITRDAALAELEKPVYTDAQLRRDLGYVKKKFGLDDEGWDEIIRRPPRHATDYPNNAFLFHGLRRYKEVFRRIATRPD